MPASKDPGPPDQKVEKRKKWSAPRLLLLSDNRHQSGPVASPVLEADRPVAPRNQWARSLRIAAPALA
jgi:hypothetical protein